MTILAAIIGLIAGFLLDGAVGGVLALAGAAFACIVISDLVSGASRRQGSKAGALAFFVALAALLVAAVSFVLPVLVILVLIALAWLGISRHRRSQKKHAGLRVLR
jgi:chromate transport protein ChrA